MTPQLEKDINNINDIMNDLGKKGFLSMIIDQKYGGNRLSIEIQSQILSKISSLKKSLLHIKIRVQ